MIIPNLHSLLLTHSAGLSYETHPLLLQYRKHRGEELHAGSNIPERFGSPLVYEPGTSWRYSPSLDWAGKLVERLTSRTLETYMKENICAPLNVEDITFLAEKHPEMKSRISGIVARIPGGLLLDCPVPSLLTASTDCEGGGGAYSSLPAYFEVLQSLLRNDEKLLKKETATLLFEPQLNGEQRKALAAQMSEPEFVGHLPPHVGWDHGLGGILSSSDAAGWRRKGTLIWTGLFNLIWVSSTHPLLSIDY
jgi:CubicO group peptidase (beta-lactamase class C family)